MKKMNCKKFGKKMSIDEFNSLTEIKPKSSPSAAAATATSAPSTVVSAWETPPVHTPPISLSQQFEEKEKVSPKETKKPSFGTKRVDMRKGKKIDIHISQKPGVIGLNDIAGMYPSETSAPASNYDGIEAIQMNFQEYRDYVVEKNKIREKELRNCRTPGEMVFLSFLMPEMNRDQAITEILNAGVKMFTTGSGSSELTASMVGKPTWRILVNHMTACFKLSKNGKNLFADFRPLFHGMDEVQVAYYKENGEIDFSRPPLVINITKVASNIIRLLA